MKLAAGLLIVLALVVGVVPAYTDCQSQGRALALANGNTVPMKCHWSGVAELSLAVPLGLVGVSTAFSKRKETRRMLAILGMALGAVVIAVPTVLIGVCGNADMICNSVMRPTLILSGGLVMAISLVFGILNERAREDLA